MIHLEKEPIPSHLTESGIRRILGGNFLEWLKKRFVPYMTKKHSEEKQIDPSQATWRGYQSLVGLGILSLSIYISTHMGSSNDTSSIQKSLDRMSDAVQEVQGDVKVMGHRMEMVETQIGSMGKRVDALQAAVDGALRGMRL